MSLHNTENCNSPCNYLHTLLKTASELVQTIISSQQYFHCVQENMPSTKNKAKFYLPNRGKITQALIYFVRLLIRWPRSDGQSKKTWKQFRVNKRRKRQTKTQRKCRIPVQGTYIFELRPFFFNFIRLCTYKCC